MMMDRSEVKDIKSLVRWMNENNFSPRHFDGESRAEPEAKPYLWKWADVEECMSLVTKFVTTEDTTRRTIPLVNPRNAPGVSILGMGLQCILPGEQEISHRHTASALRFVVKGNPDAFNLGGGEPMPFDFRGSRPGPEPIPGSTMCSRAMPGKGKRCTFRCSCLSSRTTTAVR